MIEVLKQALEALETEVSIDWTNNDEFNASAEKMHDAIASLRQAIAELEREKEIHDRHCNQGEWKGVCKYSDSNCPTIAELESHESQIKTTDSFESAKVKYYNRGWNDCLFASGIVKQLQRTWVGLTDEEIEEIRESTYQEFIEIIRSTGRGKREPKTFVRAIEAKLKQKNGFSEEKKND